MMIGGIMGKFSKMLYLIDLLNTGNKYSLKELSSKIGVSERMIRYYKEELEEDGIYIESFKGPNGGYFMLDKLKNYTYLNKYDIQLLKYSYEVLKNTNFEFIGKYNDLLNKISNMSDIYEEKSKFVVNIDQDNLTQKFIMDSIKKSESINIVYKNIDGTISNRIIYPLQTFKYKDNDYVTAYCELRRDIRHFEINRIIKVK